MFRILVLVAVAGGVLCSPFFPAQAEDLVVGRTPRAALPVREVRTLVLPVSFADGTPQFVTPEALQERVFGQANAFWQETTYGKLRLTGRTLPWNILHSFTTCSTASTRLAAVTAVDGQVDFRLYDQVVIVAPFQQSTGGGPCAWSVEADAPGVMTTTADGIVPLSFVYVHAGAATVGNLAYAVGRAFGLGNANFLDCGAASIASTGCRTDVYGDYYSVMSRPVQPRHLNAVQRERLGVFDGVRPAVTITSNAIIPLTPIESPSAGVKAIKILRGIESPLYVEYRQPIGSDSGMDQAGFSTVFQGALLHVVGTTVGESLLIDPTPPGEPHRAALEVGQMFVDPATGVRITVLSQTSSQLWLQIIFPRCGLPVDRPRVHSA